MNEALGRARARWPPRSPARSKSGHRPARSAPKLAAKPARCSLRFQFLHGSGRSSVDSGSFSAPHLSLLSIATGCLDGHVTRPEPGAPLRSGTSRAEGRRGGRGGGGEEEAAAAAAGGGGGKREEGGGKGAGAGGLAGGGEPRAHSLAARRTEEPVPKPRQPSQPGAVLGPLAARERAARDRASPSAPSRRAPGPRAPECGAASPWRRQKDPSARRGRTGDKEAPGRDEESLGGGGAERTPGPPAAAAGSRRAAHAGSPGDQPRPGEGTPAAPALASSLCPGGQERATRLGPAAAAAPPSPVLSAPPGSAAAAASSVPAPPPASRKSPLRT
ncbi:uncharacterized protein LOC118146891 [Callithrix jacchus]